eukprot:jgi/Chlat1/5127/Chrsp33S05029
MKVEAPVFQATWDDVNAPFEKFIEKIEEEAAPYGICKIIPPAGWTPRKGGYDDSLQDRVIEKPIRQHITGRHGVYSCVLVEGKRLTVREYKALAETPQHKTPERIAAGEFETLERAFWKTVTLTPPLYAADNQGTLYDSSVQHWNIAHLDTILSRTLDENGVLIPGVTSAYLYYGMWRAMFAWHTEDMDLYSVNYLHYGEPKSWYCIAPAHRARFELLLKGLLPDVHKACPEFMRHKEIIVSPTLLHQNNIPFIKLVQEPGQFIINFPGAYHAGFNHGYNCAESTNFATKRWVQHGAVAKICNCRADSVRIDMSLFGVASPMTPPSAAAPGGKAKQPNQYTVKPKQPNQFTKKSQESAPEPKRKQPNQWTCRQKPAAGDKVPGDKLEPKRKHPNQWTYREKPAGGSAVQGLEEQPRRKQPNQWTYRSKAASADKFEESKRATQDSDTKDEAAGSEALPAKRKQPNQYTHRKHPNQYTYRSNGTDPSPVRRKHSNHHTCHELGQRKRKYIMFRSHAHLLSQNHCKACATIVPLCVEGRSTRQRACVRRLVEEAEVLFTAHPAGAAATAKRARVCQTSLAPMNLERWVQCEACNKWRHLSSIYPGLDESSPFFCQSLPFVGCSMPEEHHDEGLAWEYHESPVTPEKPAIPARRQSRDSEY